MALTSEQKFNVIFYLGWPGKTLVAGSTHYNQTVATRLTNLDQVTEEQVDALLTEIATLRTKYTGSSSRMLVKKVGDIELNTDEHRSLGSEYRRVLNDLSQLLDIKLFKSSGININVCI